MVDLGDPTFIARLQANPDDPDAKVRGDRELAFAQLMEAHLKYVLAYIKKKFRSLQWEDVEEIASNTMLKVDANIRKFEVRHPGSLKAWINKISENEARTYIAGMGRVLPDVEQLDRIESPIKTDEVKSEGYELCLKALDSLSESDKTILRLRLLIELSFDEIGSKLNITSSAARKRFERALKRVHDTYTKLVPKE